MVNKKLIGDRLKELRNKSKKNQESVANEIGISRARYSHYENNHVEPDIELINKLAEYYKVTTDYLLGNIIYPIHEESSSMLGKRLKGLRVDKGITQEELGERINTTKGTISNYENQHSTPSNEMLKGLANALDATTDYLLGRTDNPNSQSNVFNSIGEVERMLGGNYLMGSETLASRLRKLRDRKGYLQKYVADRIGVKSNTLSGYENGTRSPDPDMIKDLAKLYDVTTDYLLGATDSPNYHDDEFNKLLDKYEIEHSGFFDIEKWKVLNSEEIKQLEGYFEYIVENAKKRSNI